MSYLDSKTIDIPMSINNASAFDSTCIPSVLVTNKPSFCQEVTTVTSHGILCNPDVSNGGSHEIEFSRTILTDVVTTVVSLEIQCDNSSAA